MTRRVLTPGTARTGGTPVPRTAPTVTRASRPCRRLARPRTYDDHRKSCAGPGEGTTPDPHLAPSSLVRHRPVLRPHGACPRLGRQQVDGVAVAGARFGQRADLLPRPPGRVH